MYKQLHLCDGQVSKPLSVLTLFALLLISCAALPHSLHAEVNNQPRLEEKKYISFDGDSFGYRKWLPKASGDIHTVIVGVHGISGYSGDYQNLAKHLLKESPGTVFYAAETRGQGLDPQKHRIGDISSPDEWYQDLYTFSALVRKKHPKAKMIWLGESMGSLIIAHAYHNAPEGVKKPDALILSSPIVDVSAKVEAWKINAAHIVGSLLPKMRISLETFSNGERPVVTKDDIHKEQSAKNEWYIPRYTLRLLLTLGKMADHMNQLAKNTHCPTLILHGGKDIFTPAEIVDAFQKRFPEKKATYHRYKDSFHLLMYDHQRQKIFKDISAWLRRI